MPKSPSIPLYKRGRIWGCPFKKGRLSSLLLKIGVRGDLQSERKIVS
jgi:hypothetical protein